MHVLGVDGCRGGWLVARVEEPATTVRWLWVAQFAEVYADDAAAVIAVDIPIGLPAGGPGAASRRACDTEARRLLGARGASVFPAPVRPMLGCRTYAEARALLATLGGPSMSAQAFGIVRAVADVDACVGPDDDRVIEAHPELAFRALAAGTGAAAPAYGKKTAAGHAERVALLAAVWPDVAEVVAAAPRPAARDDAADAMACAWVAGQWRSGRREVLGDGERDERGLPMRIAPAPSHPA